MEDFCGDIILGKDNLTKDEKWIEAPWSSQNMKKNSKLYNKCIISGLWQPQLYSNIYNMILCMLCNFTCLFVVC